MANRVYSVIQINQYIKNMFSNDFVLKSIMIRGEVSNCKYHSSGHLYFTLKDQEDVTENQKYKATGSWSAIACVMFARDRMKLPFCLKDGQKVIIEGSVNVYTQGGQYQVYVTNIRLDGIGELYLKYEQIKSELSQMGMFDPMYKKPIPKYAFKIGVVTAKTGAAIQDIINITKRRNPKASIYLYPALVQGAGAKDSICQGIKFLDRLGLDCIIVGRGGGSIEDLWAFNEPEVAYAIFEANTPIISAVGHQTDTTIADFVSDLRAPTPSAAAELANFELSKFYDALEAYQKRLNLSMDAKIKSDKHQIDTKSAMLKAHHPLNTINMQKSRLLNFEKSLLQRMEQCLEKNKSMLSIKKQSINQSMNYTMDKNKHLLAMKASLMDELSPLKRLSGGYSFAKTKDETPLVSVKQLNLYDDITVYLTDGKLSAKVEKIEEEKYDH